MKMKKRVVAAIVGAALLILGAILGLDLADLNVPFTEMACSVVECTQ